MANIVYDYPKSSCNCYKCTAKKYDFPTKGIPTNMSVRDCDFPAYFECYDDKPFRADIEPRIKQGYTNLNPQVMTQQFARDFHPTSCKERAGCCPEVQWASMDPRLVSASHSGQVQTLDRPPITGDMPLCEVAHSKLLDKFGQNYKTYSDVNAGQVAYYTDASIEDPYFSPNFVTSSLATGTLYKDPMGALKPSYKRTPLTDNDPMGPERDNYEGCLSWMEDSLSHRQDLMSKQMHRRNEQRWMPRWSGKLQPAK